MTLILVLLYQNLILGLQVNTEAISQSKKSSKTHFPLHFLLLSIQSFDLYLSRSFYSFFCYVSGFPLKISYSCLLYIACGLHLKESFYCCFSIACVLHQGYSKGRRICKSRCCQLKAANWPTSLCCRVGLPYTAIKHVLRLCGSKQILARVDPSTIPC